MSKITFHDRGYPGDQLTAVRDGGLVGFQCITGSVCTTVDLTDAQARELAEWILGQVNS